MTAGREIWWVYPPTGSQMHAVLTDGDPDGRLCKTLCDKAIQVRPVPFMALRNWSRDECTPCRLAVDANRTPTTTGLTA